ncbi:MAG: hypothetical protein IPP94_13770 [Ignavibacteria bacterium]|nr:hypothetical protein [Ignavibacteria bacterium]
MEEFKVIASLISGAILAFTWFGVEFISVPVTAAPYCMRLVSSWEDTNSSGGHRKLAPREEVGIEFLMSVAAIAAFSLGQARKRSIVFSVLNFGSA